MSGSFRSRALMSPGIALLWFRHFDLDLVAAGLPMPTDVAIDEICGPRGRAG